ncbi:hypothetical protein IU483_09530 [Streptomyces gardneri]|nr:hypothetical protein [Streptomyces gardneri]
MIVTRWTGVEVRALRQAALRRSQEEFAAMTGFSDAVVRKWERRGASITLTGMFAAGMDTVLESLDARQLARFRMELSSSTGIADHRLKSDTEQISAGDRADTGEWTGPQIGSTLVDGSVAEAEPAVPESGGDPTDRRDALRALGITGVATSAGLQALVFDSARESARLVSAVARPGIDPDSLHDAAEDLHRLASEYALAPDLPRLFRALTVLRDQLAAAMHHAGKPADMRELYALFAATCILLASVSHDLAEPQAAMIQTRAATRFAVLAGHRSLESWVRCTRAMIASWWGRPEQVLSEVRNAADAHGISRIRLAGLGARAHAQLGDRTAAVAAMRLARAERERVPDVDSLTDLGPVFDFSHARQHYYDAITYATLGEWTQAQSEAERVTELYAPTRSQAWPTTLTLAQTTLARARLHSDGPSAALEELGSVFTIPVGQRIPQVVTALRALKTESQAQSVGKRSDSRTLVDAVDAFIPEFAHG